MMKTKNNKLSSYWDSRAIERVQRNYKDTLEFIQYLNDMYNRAIRKIEKDIIYRLEKIAVNNNISLSEAKKRLNGNELKEFKMSLKEYIEKGSGILDEKTIKELEEASNIYHISQLQAMEIELKAEVKTLYSKYEKKTGEVLKDMYSDSYYRTSYDIQKITGYNHITQLNPRKLEVIINKPWAPDQRAFSQRIWGNSEVVTRILHKELGIGIALGEHPGAIAKRLTDKLQVSKRAAYTLAHTESAYFTELATLDSYKEHKVKKYQILSTLDIHTSQICRDMDQKVFKIEDKKTGVNYPPFHPNCRTTTIPYFKDLGGTRCSRDPTDRKTIEVDGKLKYKDWYKEYVNNNKELEKMNLQIFAKGDKESILKKIDEGIISKKMFEKHYKFYKARFNEGLVSPIEIVFDRTDSFYHIVNRHHDMINEEKITRLYDLIEKPSAIYESVDKFGNIANCYLENEPDNPLIVIVRNGIITAYEPSKNYLKKLKKGRLLWKQE